MVLVLVTTRILPAQPRQRIFHGIFHQFRGGFIIFGTFIDQGELTKLAFFSENDAQKESDYILSATPQEWKRILRKEGKFVGDFLLGKIKLELGSKVGVLGIAPHSGNLVDWLTQVDLQFPDEMSAEERAQYRQKLAAFRRQAGV